MKNILMASILLMSIMSNATTKKITEPSLVLGTIHTLGADIEQYTVLGVRAVMSYNTKGFSIIKKECNVEGKDFKLTIVPDGLMGTPLGMDIKQDLSFQGRKVMLPGLVEAFKQLKKDFKKSISSKCSIDSGYIGVEVLVQLSTGQQMVLYKSLQVKNNKLQVLVYDTKDSAISLPSETPVPLLLVGRLDW